MIEVGSRVIVSTPVAEVFKGITGEVIKIENGFDCSYYVIDMDPEFLAKEEITQRLGLNVVILGDYFLVSRDDEVELIDNSANLNKTNFEVGQRVKVVNCFDSSANGLEGVIRHLDEGDNVAQVEFNFEETNSPSVKIAMIISKSVFGYHSLPLDKNEIEVIN